MTVLTGASAPPLVVDPTLPEPALYGLYSAARMLELTDPHGASGVEVQSYPCEAALGFDFTCDPEDQDPKDLDRNQPDPQAFAPLSVFGKFSCGPFGVGVDQAAERARADLSQGEQRTVERLFHERTLQDAGTTVLGGGVVDLVPGLGLLEQALGTGYGGVGIVHAPRLAGPLFAAAAQVETSGGKASTKLGTRISFGGGYPNESPAGAAAAAGTVWLYATPMVTLRRGPVVDVPGRDQALDRTTDALVALAERVVIPEVDCGPVVAVNVTLETQ